MIWTVLVTDVSEVLELEFVGREKDRERNLM